MDLEAVNRKIASNAQEFSLLPTYAGVEALFFSSHQFSTGIFNNLLAAVILRIWLEPCLDFHHLQP